MNYFAHGFPFVDQPYFLAGTALPDWLGVADRAIRLPPRKVMAWSEQADSVDLQILQGVLRHYQDDAQFHVNPAFAGLCTDYRLAIQQLDRRLNEHVAGLMAHIAVELLLDSALIDADGILLDRYYAALAKVEPERIAAFVSRVTGRDPARLVRFIEIFRHEEFLRDYSDDERLCFRLTQIFSRACRQSLPNRFASLLPTMRREVLRRRSHLLPSVTMEPLDRGASRVWVST